MAQPNGAAPNGSAETQNSNTEGPKGIIINSQYLRDLSFENPNAPFSLATNAQNPDVSFEVDVEARSLQGGEDSQGRPFEVVLKIRAQVDAEGKTLFLIECDYGALVVLGQDIPDNALAPVLKVEVPYLLFPFVRNIIAEAVQNGGFRPLLVNPLDFRNVLQQRFAQEQQQAAAAPASS